VSKREKRGYLDHAFTTPSFKPPYRTLLEECRITLTADGKLAAREVHYDGNVQVSLNTCSQHPLNWSPQCQQ